jgi:signal transduction histidine kinase
VPLINRHKQCIGVFQALNKKSYDGAYSDFTRDDLELLSNLSSFVVIALENSKLYEEMRLLDKSKERMINHIAHEMKTPLAIVSTTLSRVSRKISEGNAAGLEKSLEMAKRNIDRLLQLQQKIDDILNEREFNQKLPVMHVIEDAFGFIETLKDQRADYGHILEHVSNYIESFYSMPKVRFENIELYDFLQQMHREAIENIRERRLEIITDFVKGVSVHMDKEILQKTCAGLLKNAIENTPDEGRIEVRSRVANDGLFVEFRDYGVGITNENQGMIFGGFFHTQDTSCYSSKEPYAFNAGGAGADLLRIKVFSERCGFSVGFESNRCHVLPGDTDQCPGRISRCPNIRDKSECVTSGGSLFTLGFRPQSIVN